MGGLELHFVTVCTCAVLKEYSHFRGFPHFQPNAFSYGGASQLPFSLMHET